MIEAALDARAALLQQLGDDTDMVRLFHGIAEGEPGLTVDRYGPILLIQSFREPISLDRVEAIHREVTDCLAVDLTAVWNHRGKPRKSSFADFHDPVIPADPIGLEHGLRFDVRPRHRGIDPLLFLDFRVARRLVRERAADKTVLNTFAYTCGAGVAAAAGGASEVVNLDFATSALEVGQANARRNGVGARSRNLQSDYFPAIRQFAGLGVGGRAGRRPSYAKVERQQFDIVILDPPRYAKSRWGVVDVVRDYPSLFKPALLATAPGGHLLATNNHAKVDVDDWQAILQRTASKAGRPILDIELLEPDADFPSFDGKPPLKLAWISV